LLVAFLLPLATRKLAQLAHLPVAPLVLLVLLVFVVRRIASAETVAIAASAPVYA
jgi:hypothetical protein